jgi:hypothetical protein
MLNLLKKDQSKGSENPFIGQRSKRHKKLRLSVNSLQAVLNVQRHSIRNLLTAPTVLESTSGSGVATARHTFMIEME